MRCVNLICITGRILGAEGVKGDSLLLIPFAQPGAYHSATRLCTKCRGCARTCGMASLSEFPFPKAAAPQPVLAMGQLPRVCACPLQSPICLALSKEGSCDVSFPICQLAAEMQSQTVLATAPW